jgi:thiosulfate/3-mercaptopyruvate sulfurtransferase
MRRLLLTLLSLGALLGAQAAHALQVPGPLVDPDWLDQHRGQVTILDVREDLKSFTDKPVFVKDKKSGDLYLRRIGGHIPGAHLVNYKKVRTSREIDGRKITRLIPPKDQFEKLMQQAGVNKGDAIVIVTKGESNGDMTMATRMYWQIKYFGHDNLAILNGGLAGWLYAGKDISIDAGKPKPGNWVASAERNDILASSDDVAKAVDNKSAQLIDTRPMSLYLGTWHKSYVKADGHIPGAKVFPNELLTDPGAPAKFTSKDKLKTLAEQLGIKTDGKLITYCNSGHLASGSWFVMSELLGNKNVKLYDGSMHEWTTEGRPTTKLKME